MITFDKECCLAWSGAHIVLYFTDIVSRIWSFGKEKLQWAWSVVFDNRAIGTGWNLLLVFKPLDGQWWRARDQYVKLDFWARQNIHGFRLFKNPWWFWKREKNEVMLLKPAYGKYPFSCVTIVWLDISTCAQTFDKQDPRALDSSCFVFSHAGIAAAIFTVKIWDFQKSNIFKECAFVFLISLDFFLISVPLYGYRQWAGYKTLQMSKRSFDTFRLF